MTDSPSSNIPPILRNKHYCFLIPGPENFAISNGISVLLDAVTKLRSLGLKVDIVPSHTSNWGLTQLQEPYADLPIRRHIPEGCSAIVSDTICKERLQEVRARAAQICHYTMAPNGLFGAKEEWANRVELRPGEKQAVYSPQVSTKFPTFFLQTHYADLDHWIEISKKQSKPKRSRNLEASIYPGKGHIKRTPKELCIRINRSRSNLITRFRPATKAELYQELARSDLLISYDPITSLTYEASLLGIPTFIPIAWDEMNFKSSFPVRLDGIVWNDLNAFLNILEHGFDHQAVVDSYRKALARNTDELLDLLNFAFGDSTTAIPADQVNTYWDSRQSFFTTLQLPCDGSHVKIRQALPARNATEFAYDLADTCSGYLAKIYQKLYSSLRPIARRLRGLLR